MPEKIPKTQETVELDFSEREAHMAAEKAAARIEKISKRLGPELTARLVESNIVLTLGDARGQTDFVVYEPSEEILRQIESANEALDDPGIHFGIPKKFTGPFGDPGVIIDVESAKGYEQTTRNSGIPGIMPIDMSRGWKDLESQEKAGLANLKVARNSGLLPKDLTDEALTHMYIGVIKGYPSRAILDIADAISHKRDIAKTMRTTDIPSVSLYGGAQPNYDYYPEHAEDPEILEHQKYWESILDNFYRSKWHKALSKNIEFKKTRESMKEAQKRRIEKRKE